MSFAEIGPKRANGFELYAMLGNVWEWVNDWYNPNYYENGTWHLAPKHLTPST